MDAVRFMAGQKCLANDIADSTGFEGAGWLEILEFEEYAAAVLVSKGLWPVGVMNRKTAEHNSCI